MGLVEAGVGAAGAAVLPLAALHHARNLQARHYRETPVPHLQGAAHDSQFIKKKNQQVVQSFQTKIGLNFLTMNAGITGC